MTSGPHTHLLSVVPESIDSGGGSILAGSCCGTSAGGEHTLTHSLYVAAILPMHCLWSSSENPPDGGQNISFERLSFEQLFRQSELSSAKLVTVIEQSTCTKIVMIKILMKTSFFLVEFYTVIMQTINSLFYLGYFIPLEITSLPIYPAWLLLRIIVFVLISYPRGGGAIIYTGALAPYSPLLL